MKIDFSQELKTIRGAPLKERVVTEESPEGVDEVITLGGVAIGALLTPEQSVEGKTKAKRCVLAFRIQAAKDKDDDGGAITDFEISVSDVALIKRLTGKHFGALVVGQAWEMLDPQPKEELEESKAKAKPKAKAEEPAKKPAEAQA